MPGRMRKIFGQLASLCTNLPGSIFICYGERQPDILDALVIGPEDTPYENGIYEFNLFCGKHFPEVSHLGTWEGQPWEVDRSTLLQVLVSIQCKYHLQIIAFEQSTDRRSPSSNDIQ
jgi:Ubiquitin-protein ligase